MKKFIVLILIGTLSSGCVTSRININTNVNDARVIVDGELLGQTPINSVEVKNRTGRPYKVIIEKEGYKTYQGVLQKEYKPLAATATVFGYLFCWLILPAPLMIYALYAEGPMSNHYFVLEAKEAEAIAVQSKEQTALIEVNNQATPEAEAASMPDEAQQDPVDGAADADSEAVGGE